MHAQRLRRLRKAMKHDNIQNFLVSDLQNIAYLSGIHASAAQMLVTHTSCFLCLDERYAEMAMSTAQRGITVLHPQSLSSKLKKLSTIAIEGEKASALTYTTLVAKYTNTRFTLTSDLVEKLRRTKDADEIRCIQKACAISRRVMKKVPTFLRLGVTEEHVAWCIESACRSLGADCMAFESIVAFGTHTSRPHHRPTKRRLKRGDIVQVDMGARYNKYCSDFSRVFCFGSMTAVQSRAYAALSTAKKKAEALLKRGVSTHRLDRTVRSALATSGYAECFPHALGHGVGMDIHEDPVLSQKRPDDRLRKGDVITIEPGLYFDGDFGMRLEDTHVIG